MIFFKRIQRLFNESFISPLVLIILITIALLVRLNVVMLGGPDSVGASDDALFLGIARQFYEGNIIALFHPYWMPLFPFIASIFYKIIGSWSYAAGTTNAFSGALLLIPIYFIGKSYANRQVGLFAAFLVIFSYPLFLISHTTYTESLQVFLFWMGMLFCVKTLDANKSIYAFLTGVFWGLTFLTRSEGLTAIIGLLVCNSFLTLKKYLKIPSFYLKAMLFILIPIYLITNGFVALFIIFLILFFLLQLLINNSYEIKTNLFKTTFFVLLGFSIFYFLYNGMLIVKYKKPLFSAKAVALLNYPSHHAYNKSHTSTWGQDIATPETFNPNSEFIGNFYETLFSRQQSIINSAVGNTFIVIPIILSFIPELSLIFFLIGMFWLVFKNKNYPKTLILLLLPVIMVFFTTMFSPVGASDRYTYFTAPLILLGIAFGANYLSTFFKPSKVKIFIMLLMIIFISRANLIYFYSKGEQIVFNTSLTTYSNFFFGEKISPYDNTKEAKLLRNKTVMAGVEINGFNNKGRFIYDPPAESLDELVKYARRWRVDYIVAGPSEITGIFSFLYKEPKDYPGLKLAFSKLDKVIYKVIY